MRWKTSLALLLCCFVAPCVEPASAEPPAEISRGGNPDKVGRFMFNLKIGPALGAYHSAHLGAIVLEGGWSVLPNKNLYLVLPLQFHFAVGGGSFILPVGMQLDIPLPVRGLYVYPRFSLGYLLAFANGATSHFGVITPELGLKYVINGRWNVGGELVSLPIAFNGAGAAIQYRILLSAGANF